MDRRRGAADRFGARARLSGIGRADEQGSPQLPTLIAPDVALRASYVAALAEFHAEGRYSALDARALSEPARFADFVAERRAAGAAGSCRPPYRVPETVLWWAEGTSFIGHVSIRHELTMWLFEQGGHIGYDVRPSARRLGHATSMLAAALPFAAALGIDPALVTCMEDNVASRRVIERAGGELEDVRRGRLRFWVATGADRVSRGSAP